MEIKVREWVPSESPGPCKIAAIAEAPGEKEALLGRPLVGRSGQLYDRLLKDSGIVREEILTGNVFPQRPPDNKVKFFFMGKAEAKKSGWAKECPYPIFSDHGYVRPEWAPQLDRLKEEIEECRPNIVICMGAVSLWAFTGLDKIGKYRGAILESTLIPGQKVIATYHPAAILRAWGLLPVTAMDFRKAKDHSASPEIVRHRREIWIEPTLEDLDKFYTEYIEPAESVAFDIETEPARRNITCIGFAPTEHICLVVPFRDLRSPTRRYWSREEEKKVWLWVRRVLENKKLSKIGQNVLYDIQWMVKYPKIKTLGPVHDTMLLHHALQPELRKDLGTLSSLYLDEPMWKDLSTFKVGEEKDDA